MAEKNDSPGFYFGVDVAFESIDETVRIVDEVCPYTNLFVLGCYGPTTKSELGRAIYNETRLNFLSDYVYGKGLSFIVYSDSPGYPSAQWRKNAELKFSDKFLGIYYSDEPGGKQLDLANYPAFYYAENFSDAADRFVNSYDWWLRGPRSITNSFGDGTHFPLFTSDYGLYWFDYQAGYDTVFAEFGWNSGREDYSRQLNAALVRGAATAMGKDWGIMITWAYQQPPYMESGPDLYKDMVSAYQNGAKYIIVFDSNEDWTENVLDQEHFDAMNQFWQYAQANPRTPLAPSNRILYVLPEDYGEGFRSPDDTIWGLWRADFNINGGSENFTTAIRLNIATLLEMFGPKLDIAYQTPERIAESKGYETVFSWSDTTLVPNALFVPPQSPAGDPLAWQLITPKPSVLPLGSVNVVNVYGGAVGILILTAGFVSISWLRRTRKPVSSS